MQMKRARAPKIKIELRTPLIVPNFIITFDFRISVFIGKLTENVELQEKQPQSTVTEQFLQILDTQIGFLKIYIKLMRNYYKNHVKSFSVESTWSPKLKAIGSEKQDEDLGEDRVN